MFRVHLQSRLGNIVLGIAGASYVVAAIVLLVWNVLATIGTGGLRTMLVNAILAGTVVAGAWIVANSVANLGGRFRRASR